MAAITPLRGEAITSPNTDWGRMSLNGASGPLELAGLDSFIPTTLSFIYSAEKKRSLRHQHRFNRPVSASNPLSHIPPHHHHHHTPRRSLSLAVGLIISALSEIKPSNDTFVGLSLSPPPQTSPPASPFLPPTA